MTGFRIFFGGAARLDSQTMLLGVDRPGKVFVAPTEFKMASTRRRMGCAGASDIFFAGAATEICSVGFHATWIAAWFARSIRTTLDKQLVEWPDMTSLFAAAACFD